MDDCVELGCAVLYLFLLLLFFKDVKQNSLIFFSFFFFFLTILHILLLHVKQGYSVMNFCVWPKLPLKF